MAATTTAPAPLDAWGEPVEFRPVHVDPAATAALATAVRALRAPRGFTHRAAALELAEPVVDQDNYTAAEQRFVARVARLAEQHYGVELWPADYDALVDALTD